MTPSQAAELVTYLVAVFRPRDFGDASASAYAHSIQEFDYDEARRSVEWIAEHDRFFPVLSRLRAEIADDYAAPPIATLDRTALPGYRPPMLPGDVAPEVVEVAHHATRTMTGLIDDPHIRYNPEQVGLRKAEAKAAAEVERQRIAAEKRDSNGKAEP